MMEEFEDIIHRDIDENETETNIDTLYKVIEKFLDIASPNIMDDCVNGELDDMKNSADAKINNMNERERKFSDTTSTDMVVKYEDTTHKANTDEKGLNMVTLDK